MVAAGAVTEAPVPGHPVALVTVRTRPVYAGTTKRSAKTPSDAAPLAPFRETGTPGTNCGVVAW